ncbi:putative 26S proteasome regulatory subunit [Coemansia interrupta]|uniref:26S proteasome regulatory subunit n=1 Tax=Coemansia interrupta TaxID=1126814 RepID=A0A9W8HK63_9FUNG|nr:putative 26S proteasome regulatory subunit [Coemansia interrupta]
MDRLQDLVRQKTSLEARLRALDHALAAHGVTRTTPLVDPSGFPRSDLDINSIVDIRRELNYKQNDLGQLMAEIEKALQAVHQQPQPQEKEAERLRGFARISGVAKGGPAELAGVRDGDVVVRVGGARGFSGVAEEVAGKADGELVLVVDRVVDGAPERLTLAVRPHGGWGGGGLLGCRMTEIPQ